MKNREYKEAVTKNLKSIRRSSDLEMLYKFSELCKGWRMTGQTEKILSGS